MARIAAPVHRLSVAPMMDHTHRDFRYLCRLLSRRVWLFTEMITPEAIVYGRRQELLAYHPGEHPVALQLGGSDPTLLTRAGEIAADLGYDEINLNCGCPSDRVRNHHFGACLMDEPHRVADCVAAMAARLPIPVTVKHRIGVDERDSYEHMRTFVDVVAQAGCGTFIVHARKAWLKGLSPKENREIPPLRYEEVWRLKEERPDLVIEINGGITTLEQAAEQLTRVDGVMMGRSILDDPGVLARVDQEIYQEEGAVERPLAEVVRTYAAYAGARAAEGARTSLLVAPLLGLFKGRPGARSWRRHLSEGAAAGRGPEIIAEALSRLEHSPPGETEGEGRCLSDV